LSTDSLQAAINQMVTSFTGAMDTWLVLALMVALFVAATFRPQQVRDRRRFRSAIALLGLYLVIPVAVGLVLLVDPTSEAASIISQLGSLVGRLVLALSIVRALQSLIPAHDAPDMG